MLLAEIHIWHIYLDPKCEHTDPVKPKYVVVAAIEGEVVHGFLINSKTPKFVTSTPELAPCDVPLLRENYSFLHLHAVSHIDFTRPYEFQAKHLTEGYGKLMDDDIFAFALAVNACPRLDAKKKRLFKAAGKRIMDNDGKE